MRADKWAFLSGSSQNRKLAKAPPGRWSDPVENARMLLATAMWRNYPSGKPEKAGCYSLTDASAIAYRASQREKTVNFCEPFGTKRSRRSDGRGSQRGEGDRPLQRSADFCRLCYLGEGAPGSIQWLRGSSSRCCRARAGEFQTLRTRVKPRGTVELAIVAQTTLGLRVRGWHRHRTAWDTRNPRFGARWKVPG